MGQSSQGILGKPGTSNMLLLAILLLGVGIQAAPQGGFLSGMQSSSSSGAASSSSMLDSKDVVETNGGKWVWSEVRQKYEWEAEAGAKQNYESSYQPKCSYQPKEECTTVYENVEREVTNEECQTVEECRVEYKLECHTEKCKEVGHSVCEKKPVCVNVVTKKTERVPRQRCNTVQKKVCY